MQWKPEPWWWFIASLRRSAETWMDAEQHALVFVLPRSYPSLLAACWNHPALLPLNRAVTPVSSRLWLAFAVIIPRYKYRRDRRSLNRRWARIEALVDLGPHGAIGPVIDSRQWASRSVAAAIGRVLAAHVPAWHAISAPWRMNVALESECGSLLAVMRVRGKIVAVHPVPPGSVLK